MKIAFIVAVCLLMIWRTKKGFHNGMMKEVVTIISVIVSCACIALLFFMISSIVAHTFTTLAVCVAGLIGIGLLFKFCNLIFGPITAITEISVVSGLDKLAGVVMGICEAALLSWILYRGLDYFGIYVL